MQLTHKSTQETQFLCVFYNRNKMNRFLIIDKKIMIIILQKNILKRKKNIPLIF